MFRHDYLPQLLLQSYIQLSECIEKTELTSGSGRTSFFIPVERLRGTSSLQILCSRRSRRSNCALFSGGQRSRYERRRLWIHSSWMRRGTLPFTITSSRRTRWWHMSFISLGNSRLFPRNKCFQRLLATSRMIIDGLIQFKIKKSITVCQNNCIQYNILDEDKFKHHHIQNMRARA